MSTDKAPQKYPCQSIMDMARIPAEAVPRFITELPGMLEYLRPFAALGDALDPALAKMVMKSATWVDDGKTENHSTITIVESSPLPNA